MAAGNRVWEDVATIDPDRLLTGGSGRNKRSTRDPGASSRKKATWLKRFGNIIFGPGPETLPIGLSDPAIYYLEPKP